MTLSLLKAIPTPNPCCSCCEDDVEEGRLPPTRTFVLEGQIPVVVCERCDFTPTVPNPVTK